MESLQPTGSFKVRGALAAVDASRRDDPNGAVITASAGNHGLGHRLRVLRARRAGNRRRPANASAAKVKKLGNYMIELIQFGSSFDEAQAHGMALADERRFVSFALQQLQRHRGSVHGLR